MNIKQNFLNIRAHLFDEVLASSVVRTLTLTVTVKAKPDPNPYKQMLIDI